jgi:hypothetical protein
MMASQKFLVADVEEFVVNVVQISDTLSNLTYLMDLDAENPGLVRQYAKHADQLLEALVNLARPADSEECASLEPQTMASM